jgi:hydrogenase expression/formation protein HypC
VCLAIPGLVVEIVDEGNQLARVEVAGVRRVVNVGLLGVEELGRLPGRWVLVHVGFAISQVDETQAAATLELLEQMGTAYAEELEELRASAVE